MTGPRQQKSRTYSKRLIACSAVAICGLGFSGMYATNPNAPAIVDAVGSVIVTLNLLYIGSGHLDLRAMLAGGLIGGRKGRPDV